MALDFLDAVPRLFRKLVSEPLDIVAAAPRVDDAGRPGLLLDEKLGVARDAGGEIRRQRERFVERVRMQGLRAAMRRREGFDAGANHVVEHVLRRERPAARLAVRAQAHGFRVFGAEVLHELRPERAPCAHLGDFHEIVHADRPEEGEARRERIDVKARGLSGADILHAVGKRVGEFEIRRRARLLHVIAGDRDRVELRHVRARIGEDVRDDPHRGPGRIDVGVAHHELFQDVVLDRS